MNSFFSCISGNLCSQNQELSFFVTEFGLPRIIYTYFFIIFCIGLRLIRMVTVSTGINSDEGKVFY